MRSWSIPTALPWFRWNSTGRTSAAGPASTISRRRTRRKTWSMPAPALSTATAAWSGRPGPRSSRSESRTSSLSRPPIMCWSFQGRRPSAFAKPRKSSSPGPNSLTNEDGPPAPGPALRNELPIVCCGWRAIILHRILTGLR